MQRILIGLIGAAVLATATLAEAQTAPAKPAALKLTNATPGINIDIYLDAGKVGTITVDPKGEGGFDLDFLSMGKPTGQLYIETCKDGQRVRVISDGTVVPTDEGCNRKPVGVLFTFTCTGKITLNFAAARASFAGCGSLWTNRWLWVGVGGVAGTAAVASGGGGSTSAAPAVVVTPVAPVAATPPAAPAPTTPTTPTTPAPAPAAPTAPVTPAGSHNVTGCAVSSDPLMHEQVLRFCQQVRELVVTMSNGGWSVSAATMWVSVGGTYGTPFNLFRNGPLPGTSFPAVDFRFEGTVDAQGNMSGTVTIGPTGLPPGADGRPQAAVYRITTQKR